MNVETLHAIAAEVVRTFTAHNIAGQLGLIVATAQNRVNQPSEPSFPLQFDKAISELRQILPKLETNTFPPLWREYLRELDSDAWIGTNLLTAIDEVLTATAITPTLAHDGLKEIADTIQEDLVTLQSMLDGFRRFGIGRDMPDPETAEIGILIPRAAVHENLSEFGAELRKLSRIVSVFRESTHGDRPDVKLKTIASSEFSILCTIDFETAKLIAKSIGQLVEGYKILVGLKEKIQELRDAGLPEGSLQGIVDHANEKMKTTVRAVTEEITTRFPDGRIQETRKRELEIELEGALGEIATRIDKGFSFEIRAAKPRTKKGSAETEDDKLSAQAAEDRYEEISSAAKSLQYLKTDGAPMLSLPGLPAESAE